MSRRAPSGEELARLVHDVRTPLSLIVGFAELLHTRQDAQIDREAPRLIVEAAERLSRALEALLESLALGVGETAGPAAGPAPRDTSRHR